MLEPYQPDAWAFDPYAKRCAVCDVYVGSFAVMRDREGLWQVLWFPHLAWDGDDHAFRCVAHSTGSGGDTTTRLAPIWEWLASAG